ncbi:MAG: hypothetical protein ACR2IF_05180 [Terriglobales bacterium]
MLDVVLNLLLEWLGYRDRTREEQRAAAAEAERKHDEQTVGRRTPDNDL